jgi:hypothetical protein
MTELACAVGDKTVAAARRFANGAATTWSGEAPKAPSLVVAMGDSLVA